MKDSNLSHSECVCADEDTTTLPERMRTTLSGSGCWCTHRAVPRNHEMLSLTSSNGVSRNMDVVIGVRVVLRHPLMDIPLFWIFTSCSNSHLVVML